MIFYTLESDLLADMHKALYTEHVMLSVDADSDARDELAGARSQYNQYGRLRLPWLKWQAQKTAVQSYREALERRKDPVHLAKLKAIQEELDAKAKLVADAVAAELELRKAATEYAREMKEKSRRRRINGGVSRRGPRTTARR